MVNANSQRSLYFIGKILTDLFYFLLTNPCILLPIEGLLKVLANSFYGLTELFEYLYQLLSVLPEFHKLSIQLGQFL